MPEHKGLLLTACSGFTQYAYAFVQTDAELIEPKDYEASVAGRERALKMYQRALGYCLRRVELTHKGFRRAVEKDPVGDDEGVLEGGSARCSIGPAQPGERSSRRDPRSPSCSTSCRSSARSWAARSNSTKRTSLGAIHDVLISLDSLPEAMGGVGQGRSPALRALGGAVEGRVGRVPTCHWRRASASLSRIARSSRTLLAKALAIDVDQVPRLRLSNVIYQRKARALLARADDLFTPDKSPEPPTAMVGLTGLDSLAYRVLGVAR